MKKAQILTPVVTAFDQQGHVDMAAMKKIYDHVIAGGVNGIVLMGSSGEFYAIRPEEKLALIQMTVAHIAGRTKLYVGTSCMTADETIALSNEALTAGADAVMIITPYYFSLTEESIEAYYDAVAAEVKGDIFLYNYPERTVHDLSPEVTLRLLRKHKNIVGYKDTTGQMGHTRRLLNTVQDEFPEFMVFSGFDEFMVHNVLCGGCGCIGGLSNLYPELFAQWVSAINSGNLEVIASCQQKVDRLMGIYNVSQPFMPAMKKAMNVVKGLDIPEHSAYPLLPVTQAQEKALQEVLAAYEKL